MKVRSHNTITSYDKSEATNDTSGGIVIAYIAINRLSEIVKLH